MINVDELKPRNYSYYGKGSIYKNGNEVYVISRGDTYYCSCRTYEQAFYVREELNKCDWDKKELPRILDEYPIYYTDLLEFYRYITINNSSNYKWCISIPSRFSDNGVTQQIRCSNIEDALFERDFLLANDWDYELLVYCINDLENPYYDIELPPYPERTIRNVSFQKTHEEEFEIINKLLDVDMDIPQYQICRVLGVSDMTVRNWLKSYGTNWEDYKKLYASGTRPLSVLKLKRHIYKPDLSKGEHKNFKGYVHYERKRSRRNPYSIVKNRRRFGQYPTREFAEKIVKELIKCNWDKKKLKSIWAKYGYTPFKNKNYVYENRNGTFSVRKKVNDKLFTFGTYTDYDIACCVRDAFMKCNWDTSNIDSVRLRVEKEYKQKWGL